MSHAHFLDAEAARRATRGDYGLGAALVFLRRCAAEPDLIGYRLTRDGLRFFFANPPGHGVSRWRVTDTTGEELPFDPREVSAMLDRQQAMSRVRAVLALEMRRRNEITRFPRDDAPASVEYARLSA